MKLISLLPINLREAEEEKEEKPEAGADEGGEDENPFAADDAGDEAGGEEADKEGDEEETGDESGETQKPLDVSFNAAKVRKYNDVKFKGNTGTVTNISRYGLAVTLPDQQTILVNFDDIL